MRSGKYFLLEVSVSAPPKWSHQLLPNSPTVNATIVGSNSHVVVSQMVFAVLEAQVSADTPRHLTESSVALGIGEDL